MEQREQHRGDEGDAHDAPHGFGNRNRAIETEQRKRRRDQVSEPLVRRREQRDRHEQQHGAYGDSQHDRPHRQRRTVVGASRRKHHAPSLRPAAHQRPDKEADRRNDAARPAPHGCGHSRRHALGRTRGARAMPRTVVRSAGQQQKRHAAGDEKHERIEQPQPGIDVQRRHDSAHDNRCHEPGKRRRTAQRGLGPNRPQTRDGAPHEQRHEHDDPHTGRRKDHVARRHSVQAEHAPKQHGQNDRRRQGKRIASRKRAARTQGRRHGRPATVGMLHVGSSSLDSLEPMLKKSAVYPMSGPPPSSRYSSKSPG